MSSSSAPDPSGHPTYGMRHFPFETTRSPARKEIRPLKEDDPQRAAYVDALLRKYREAHQP